ncbi:MAG: hypothetical protein B6D41_10085 [Chloroflexi bacterium UTCFX4]|jgi:RHS repeat-associated protein|nr:MAG: hypothetical protein B6D41_10085 [Chloroflexi bacterium UTCFX4]
MTRTVTSFYSRQTYFPYGAQRTTEGSALPTDNTFTGQKSDDSTGLMFYGARYYDVTLGRFIQPDTIVPQPMDPQSLNRYSYVRNNPINLIDPSGHAEEPSCQAWDSWCWENRYYEAYGLCYNGDDWKRACAPTVRDEDMLNELALNAPETLLRSDFQVIAQIADEAAQIREMINGFSQFFGGNDRLNDFLRAAMQSQNAPTDSITICLHCSNDTGYLAWAGVINLGADTFGPQPNGDNTDYRDLGLGYSSEFHLRFVFGHEFGHVVVDGARRLLGIDFANRFAARINRGPNEAISPIHGHPNEDIASALSIAVLNRYVGMPLPSEAIYTPSIQTFLWQQVQPSVR